MGQRGVGRREEGRVQERGRWRGGVAKAAADTTRCQRDLFHLCTQRVVGLQIHHASPFVVAPHVAILAALVTQVSSSEALLAIAIAIHEGRAAQHVDYVIRAAIQQKGRERALLCPQGSSRTTSSSSSSRHGHHHAHVRVCFA
jgi:hypothetical protein